MIRSRLCRLITVPNDYLRQEVALLRTGARVLVTPSVIDISYFMSGKHVRFAEIPATGGPVVGLFRPSRLGDRSSGPLALQREEDACDLPG